MNIIVHLPMTDTGHRELNSRIAKLHAETTIARVKSSGYSQEQQQIILSDIINMAESELIA